MDYGIEFTWADHENNQFVALAFFSWPTPHEAQDAFDHLPSVEDSEFLADLWIDDAHVDDKYVTAALIEEFTGRSMDALKVKGNADNRKLEEMLRERLQPE
jgi:hypothetical protein